MAKAVGVKRIPLNSSDEMIIDAIESLIDAVWNRHIGRGESVNNLGYSHTVTVVDDKLLITLIVKWSW